MGVLIGVVGTRFTTGGVEVGVRERVHVGVGGWVGGRVLVRVGRGCVRVGDGRTGGVVVRTGGVGAGDDRYSERCSPAASVIVCVPKCSPAAPCSA